MAQKPNAKKSKKELEKERQRKKTLTVFAIGGAVLAVIIIVLVIVLIAQNSNKPAESSSAVSSESTASQTAESKTSSNSSADLTSVPGSEISYPIDETMDYYTDIKVKGLGVITVKLDYNAAPITTKNFLSLAESGFYNGLTFHRIMEGFMMQGGDPLGNGTGGSETKIYGEFSANGFNNPLSHTKGAISMARPGNNMNGASSQFFIVQGEGDNVLAALDGKYACFGYVTSGIEFVDKICQDARPTDNNGTIKPEEQPVIESVTVRKEKKA